ncbi:EutP/PduV family microcompartment system protein [Streptococcus iniae]|uniref:Ethanolamine utilization protein EutP n=1 Tax=Streptococcus iniae TaxID=1346 RepID=A0A3L8GQY7_STRIN|nr:EutP/PduV family microcompartment system protein [Streptococcus iniae]AGM98037.1 putative EutP/PduV family GTP-binding protein [Streptococcus iniae SF1]AHY15111.1 hypothetical protein DQ08_01115 [Streptococcus iniae]AHY16981.1 hypothetical protein DW64_01110 [Streptococcus iniae]AJG25296.1 hypothetical protein SI82_01365 [Streptococcus iniae]APD31170.1 hypothetical protein BMF34_01290 [Streptococcus iniae]
MKKRILVIGPEDDEKRKLLAMIEKSHSLKQVNSIVYHDHTIDVPSSYLRSPWMTRHIIACQQNAYCVLMLLNENREFRVYSPNFARAFRVPSIGLILRSEANDLAQREDCHRELEEASLDEIYEIVIDAQEDCQRLVDKIKLLREGKQ